MISGFNTVRATGCLVALLSILLTVTVSAQTVTVSGTVTDAASGDVLPGANVILRSNDVQTGAATDIQGRYRFRRIIEDQYRLTVSFVGYETFVMPTLSLASGESRTLNVALEPSATALNPLTVTAALGTPTKLLETPAATTVLPADELESRTALTAADHLKTAPGVDLISTGLSQSRVVIRGFNDNLASSLLTLVDNRIAQVPSIRLTALQLIPVGNFDIEQIEVVSGPASALYGPNSANGVVHVITKSPFDTRGSRISASVGLKNVFAGGISHSRVFGDRLAFRISAQYAEGDDFEYRDPVEVDARQTALQAGADPDTLLIGARDFQVQNLAVSARMDYRFSPNGSLILNSGLTQGSNIELSPTGAVQIMDARLGYLQARLYLDELFAQVFFNKLDAGDSYILRSGAPFKEFSGQWVAQIQHGFGFGERLRFTYGVDAIITRPNSEGTVSGRFEERDDINEFGAYAQTEWDLSPFFKLVAAGRLDHHNWIDKPTFSPRLAALITPAVDQAFRLTFNRAYQTPAADQLFADVPAQRDLFQGYRLEPLIGFAPTTDLWAQGSADGGFHFNRTPDGRVQFLSPYARLLPGDLTASDPLPFGDAAFTNVMWEVTRDLAAFGLPQQLVEQGRIRSSQVLPFTLALNNVLPQQLENVGQVLQILDLESQAFKPISEVSSFEPLEITRFQTLEAGYQGILADKLLLGIDVYTTRVRNLIGPFQVVTPNIFLDSDALTAYLEKELTRALAAPRNASALRVLQALDTMPETGNANGSPVDEIVNLVGRELAGQLPFGTVSPEEAFEPGDVILGRRNFGDISLGGLDTRFAYFFDDHWTMSGSYSYINKNYFEDVDDVDDVALNAPRHKFSASIRFEKAGFDGELRFRHVGSFPVRSDVYIGEVNAFSLLDASLNYSLPFSAGTRVTLTVKNVLNNEHREFVAAPELGRLGLLRITQAF